jgi:predicted metal-dependent HD superfamily phosphohydrolase
VGDSSRLAAALAVRWTLLMRDLGIHDPQADRSAAVRTTVLRAYADPRRGYHDLRHLTEVLDHVDELSAAARDADAVRLAAWFHDVVYEAGRAGAADEEASAVLAEQLLPGLGVGPPTVATVARLVRLTATHQPAPSDVDGAVLCDADLAVLARDPDGYASYVAGVRLEHAHVPAEAFRAGRAAVLRSLLDQPRLFRTDTGHDRWEDAARANVSAELASLTGGR